MDVLIYKESSTCQILNECYIPQLSSTFVWDIPLKVARFPLKSKATA
jgi:hypothetical protein